MSEGRPTDRQPRKRRLEPKRETGVVPRWLFGWRGEIVLLGLVLLAIAIFFAGYGVGMRDETFHTYWVSPLRGTSAAKYAVGSVQGGLADRSGNTPLLVTVRGLPIGAPRKSYSLYVIHAGRPPERCGYFGVGTGTTQVRLNCPDLPAQPNSWLVSAATRVAGRLGTIVLRSPGHPA